jgi:hypothetical protein
MAVATYKQTAEFRYNVKRNGVVHCAGKNLTDLCAACRQQAETCTCETCRTERAAQSNPSVKPSVATPTLTSTAPPAAPRAAAREPTPESVPPPPSLSALIRQQRGERDGTETTAQMKTAANGVPRPPRLSEHIRQLRARSGEESGNV